MAMDDKDPRVNDLLEFIAYGLSRDEAVKLLKINNNDIEAAASKFYDTDRYNLKKLLNDSVARWDETAFGAGRYGEDDPGNAIPTFNIDYAAGYDNYPHSGVQSKAPTRPPSRTSQQSALSTHYGDAPMQSIESLQESGVIGNSEPVFGPATKEYYDTSQWALVPTSTAIITDPIASERQRKEGQPGILKPSPRFNFLPALIAILHSIPIFRNALLAPDVTQKNYWMGDEWWKGNPTMPARIIDTSAGRDEAHMLDIIHETQRLLAFLDESDRAYATVSSMLELDAWKESRPILEDEDDDMLKFLVLWCTAYQSLVPDAQLNGRIRSVVNIGDRFVENLVLDAHVFRESSRPDLNLYDVLDDSLFSSATGSAHITEISKVLILRLLSSRTDAKDLGCRVPATLYADRYLEANKPVIDSMYQEMKQHEEQMREIDAAVQRLKFHTPKKENAKPLDTLKMLQTSMKAFQPRDDEHNAISNDAIVLAQLQTLYQNIESKIAALDEQTKQVRATLNSISGRFKPNIEDSAGTLIDVSDVQYPEGQSPQDAMHHPYHLRGVATNLGVVYLLHPDTQSNVPGAQQWWRMQYDTESSNPTIRRDRLTEEEVVERASSESPSVLLIYAHADAMSVEPLPLPKELHDFVKKDGLNFLEELQQNVPNSWEDMGYDTGDVVRGNWNHDPAPDYDRDWASMSAHEFHRHERNDSNLSSTTLTPNTEHDDDNIGGEVREMMEINGGMDALAGLSSSQSFGNVGEAMQVDGVRAKEFPSDAPMEDVQDEPRVQHIEMSEKKGG